MQVPSPSNWDFGLIFHGVSPNFIPCLVPWSLKALKKKRSLWRQQNFICQLGIPGVERSLWWFKKPFVACGYGKFLLCYGQVGVQWGEFLQGLPEGETWDEDPCKYLVFRHWTALGWWGLDLQSNWQWDSSLQNLPETWTSPSSCFLGSFWARTIPGCQEPRVPLWESFSLFLTRF